jgi:hypothetical protein
MSNNICRLTALCKATSAALAQKVSVLDALVTRVHGPAAKQIYSTICPVIGTSIGKQYRHAIDHIEKVAIDALPTVRDKDTLNDLHYDHRERGTFIETDDPFEARKRILFIQDTLDSIARHGDQEGLEACSLDGKKPLTAYFMLDANGSEHHGYEYPLSSTLERELGFVLHHSIHHDAIVKAIAAVGKTGTWVYICSRNEKNDCLFIFNNNMLLKHGLKIVFWSHTHAQV